MELLLAGQMADLNQISKKALRVYEQRGLIEPACVDPENGYHYYSTEQCSTIDMIQQMQAVGFSLAEMRSTLQEQDMDALMAVLEEKLDDLERRSLEIELSKHAAYRLVDSCKLRKRKPLCDVPMISWEKRRPILFFPIEPYRFQPRQTADNKGLVQWEISLRSIKRDFVERGIPLALFHNIGCVVAGDTLLDRSFVTIGGFIANNQRFLPEETRHWPEGYYLTVTIDSVFMDDGRHAEYYWMDRLIELSQEQGYTICGDYFSEMLAETPLFKFEGRDMMMRLFLPVDLGSGSNHGVEPGDPPAPLA